MTATPPKPKRTKEIPTLELAIVGKGITPEQIDIRQLGEMLTAAAATLDALARERGVAPVLPSLKRIRRGSMVAELQSKAPRWPDEIRSFHHTLGTRAEGASPAVRSAVHRIFRAVPVGAVQVSVSHVKGPELESFIAAEPVDAPAREALFETTVHGRVVAVTAAANGRIAVRIEYVDGGREEFDADTGVAERAARLFNRTVRAQVAMSWDGDRRAGVALRDLAPWNEVDFVDALLEVRASLKARGVKIDYEAAMREIDG